MTYSRSYSNYKDTQVKTASPLSLVLLLYDGALNNLRKGEVGLASEEKFADAAIHVLKAVGIVTELVGIINPKVSPELAEGLSISYKYVLSLLSDALEERNPERLVKATEVLSQLRAAWRELAQQIEKQTG